MKTPLTIVLGLVLMATGLPSMHAGPHADGATFSGRVARRAADALAVTEPMSNMTRDFTIAPGGGLSIISADGRATKTNERLSVGQAVEVEYEPTASGRLNAVRLWLLEEPSE